MAVQEYADIPPLGPGNADLPAPGEESLDAQIKREQTVMLYRQLGIAIFGTMVGALLNVVVMAGTAPTWLLAGWLSLMALNQAWRLVHSEKMLAPERIQHAAFVWMVGTLISGVLWGIGYIVMFPPASPVHQAVMTVLIFGVAAGATPLIASHIPSFYAFIFPSMLAVVARNAYEGDAPHIVLAGICFAVMLGILSFGRNFNSLLISSLRTRLENEALARRLAEKNAELEKARNIAEQANRAKTKFFAAASHDLRQPIHAMGLFASALRDRVRDPETRYAVDSINAAIESLESLFSELLDISKIDSGTVHPELSDFSLDAMCVSLRLNLAPEAAANGLELRMRHCNARVRSDPHLLERILLNLIVNALRYTPSGSVLIGARKRGDFLRIEIWDTGIGIPADEQGKIFEEFYQLANPERNRKKGLGLGLSIVKRLADLLGHRLSLCSRPGRGTVFRLEVPLAVGTMPPAPAQVRNEFAPDFSGYHFLIIDDEIVVRESLIALLGGWGAEVTACVGLTDTQEIIKTLESAPDLIIADYRLPEGPVGREAIRVVRERFGQALPAIMATGTVTPEREVEAEANDYHLLQKPVMPAKLRTLIHAILREDER